LGRGEAGVEGEEGCGRGGIEVWEMEEVKMLLK
jgi:hypothetical protein